MPEQDQLRREDIRRAVRSYLADRPAVALSPTTIARGLRAEWPDITLTEVSAALQFFVSAKQIEELTESIGSSKYYKITAEGTLAHERS